MGTDGESCKSVDVYLNWLVLAVSLRLRCGGEQMLSDELKAGLVQPKLLISMTNQQLD